MNSQYPGFVQWNYHSAYGTHTMEVCHHGWIYAGGDPVGGKFNTWADGEIGADDTIVAFTNLLLPFHKPTTVFDNYTIFTMDDPEDDPNPVYSASLGLPGTSIETEWSKAVQTTFSFGTTLFGTAKLVMLDTPSPAGFDKILGFAGSPEALAILAALEDVDNGWQARDQGRISILKQITYTLNEKLRRSYNMT